MRSSTPGPAAFLFDLWYTLIYQSPAERARYARLRRAAWERAVRAAGGTWTGASKLYPWLDAEGRRRETRGRSWSLRSQVEWWSGVTHVSLDAARIEEGVAEALRNSTVRTVPGARQLLGRLRQAGYPIGLVSNVRHEGSTAIRDLLERQGWGRTFRSVVLSSDLPFAKPSPEPIRRCLAELGVPGRRAVHVGDLPTDLEAAGKAGVPALLFVGTDRWSPSRDRLQRRRYLGAPMAVRRLRDVPGQARLLFLSTLESD